QGLGYFYHCLGEPAKEAQVYLAGAAAQSDPALRAASLTEAGLAFSRAGKWSSAQESLRQAAALSVTDPVPYQALIKAYAAADEMAQARQVVDRGREAGVDPFPLYATLAEVQENSGDAGAALNSLLAAAQYRPNDFETLLAVGRLYRERREFER